MSFCSKRLFKARSEVRRSVMSSKAREDRWRLAALAVHSAGIQQHRSPSNAGKHLLDLEILHHFGRGHDPVEEQTEGCNIPFPITQIIEQLPLRLFRPDLKRRV